MQKYAAIFFNSFLKVNPKDYDITSFHPFDRYKILYRRKVPILFPTLVICS